MEHQALRDLLALLEIPGPPGEENAVADFIRQTLLGFGFPAECIQTDQAFLQSEYGGKQGNLVVRLNGNGSGPRRMFSTHMDTVPLCVGAKPRYLEGENRIVNDAPGKALGGDNRTGCAVILQIARALAEKNGNHPPVILVFFVQEEVGLVGARGLDLKLIGEPLPRLACNFDGGLSNEFITKVIGTRRFTIQIEGVAAHSGINPEEGVSAAILAAEALTELAKAGWHGLIQKEEGQGKANLGIFHGGMGSNVVMPSVYLLAEARSHDSRFRSAIVRKWQEVFEGVVQRNRNTKGQMGKVEFGPGPTYEAFALAPDSEVVLWALEAAKRCQISPQCVSNDGGMDANWIVAHGIPALTIGAGQRNVHTPQEWIDLNHFYQACRMGIQLAEI